MDTSRFTRPAIASLLFLMLAGCAATGGADQRHGAAGRHQGMGVEQGRMDMERMCEMHKQEMAGRTPAERQALMEEHMKSMSPGMRSQIQQMMNNCR